ncbi:hypothetical protein [Sporosarcina sp. FSL W7-1283]|uniref:hypothetical protein n=1 Tax=Sporosarcina sp. FSL W7-1283 TaxID=2921560 RepID=UPI0030F958D6
MTEKQNTLQEAQKNLAEQARKFVDAAKVWIRKFVDVVSSWFKVQVKTFISFMKKYERDVARHKHNQYTRSTWHINWDTRKGNQWMNHKPVFTVRKILR